MSDERFPYGAELRDARERLGLSVSKWARLSGVSRRHAASAEEGRNASASILRKLMRPLGLKVFQIGGEVSLQLAASARTREDLLSTIREVRQI